MQHFHTPISLKALLIRKLELAINLTRSKTNEYCFPMNLSHDLQ